MKLPCQVSFQLNVDIQTIPCLGSPKAFLLLLTCAGPSTVAGMAAAKGWTSSIVPGILTSTLGYAIGSFLGIGMGHTFFKSA
eukprot:scaffold148218_cov18-Tisochrysis_lutea.AAC.1